MSTESEAQHSAPQRRLARPLPILAGVLALLGGGLIAGCVATAPTMPAATTAATTVAATTVATTAAPAAILRRCATSGSIS